MLYDDDNSNESDLELQEGNHSAPSKETSERQFAHSKKDEIDSSRQTNSILQNGHSSSPARQNGDVGLPKSKEDSSDSDGEELIPLALVPPLTNKEGSGPKKKRKKKRKTGARELPPLRPLPTLGQYSESPC